MELEEIEKLFNDLNKLRKLAIKVSSQLDQIIEETKASRKTNQNDLSNLAKELNLINVEFVFRMMSLNLKSFVQLLDSNTKSFTELLLKK
jgi:hypothetical protein